MAADESPSPAPFSPAGPSPAGPVPPGPFPADVVDLTGLVALVTGAGSGIGRATAARLARRGAAIACADIDPATNEATAEALRRSGAAAGAVETDVRRPESAERAVAWTVERFGRIDIVVNGAGIYPFSMALDTTVEVWDDVQATNVRGTFLIARAGARCMIEAGRGGAMVNIASRQAFQPTVGLGHYAASKGAIVALTKTLALEWAPHGIRVNAVAPGATVTEGTAKVARRLMDDAGPEAADGFARAAARIPLGRAAQPEEMAAIIEFLASPTSSFMTGTTVLADGGTTLS